MLWTLSGLLLLQFQFALKAQVSWFYWPMIRISRYASALLSERILNNPSSLDHSLLPRRVSCYNRSGMDNRDQGKAHKLTVEPQHADIRS